jgi:hypothetical protein
MKETEEVSELTARHAPRNGSGQHFLSYVISLSYSAWVPIQNHTMPSGASTPRARYCSPTRADQKRLTFLKCREGCFGFAFSSSKALSACSGMGTGSAL